MSRKYFRFADYCKLWEQSPIQALIPEKWGQKVLESYDLDAGRKKLFFMPWLRFMVYYLLTAPRQVSMRDIARRTKDVIAQAITGIVELSYTALGTYIKEFPSDALGTVIRRVQSTNKQLSKAQGRKTPHKATFDATFLDSTLKQWRWAAPNGTRKVVQLHLCTSLSSGLVGHWAFDLQTTSSNTCFEEIIQLIPPRSLLAFDRGYTTLELLIKLAHSGRHWVSKFYNAYTWTSVEARPLPLDVETRRGKRVIADVIGWLGHPHQGGPILTRKITVRLKKGTFKHYLTSDLKTDPVELVDFYSDHWAIENLFRSIKRYLALETVVSEDPVGVINWLLLHILFLQLLSLHALLSGNPSILKRFIETKDEWKMALHAELIERLLAGPPTLYSDPTTQGGDFHANPSLWPVDITCPPLTSVFHYT